MDRDRSGDVSFEEFELYMREFGLQVDFIPESS
jgi:hypothetical protein